jgi:hypothetical protein
LRNSEKEKRNFSLLQQTLTDSVGGCTCRGLSNGLCGGCWMKPVGRESWKRKKKDRRRR